MKRTIIYKGKVPFVDVIFNSNWFISGSYGHVPDAGTRMSVALFSKSGLEISWRFVVQHILPTFEDSVLLTYDPVSVVVDCRRG